MEKKPLTRYDPESFRNRLPVEECKMPANNASSIIIGDRTYFNYIFNIAKNIFIYNFMII